MQSRSVRNLGVFSFIKTVEFCIIIRQDEKRENTREGNTTAVAATK